MSRLALLQKELKNHGDKTQGAGLQRFFKTGPGQYGEGDIFLGLKVPLQRQIASKYQDFSLSDIKRLLASPIHEFRLSGLMILVGQYQAAPSLSAKKKIVDFYLRHTAGINNWDLVDLSSHEILGDYLVRSRRGPGLLLRLSASRNLWERRIAMVSTYAFIRSGDYAATFAVARKLLKDEHDLIHKAVGWMLREAGKRVSEPALLKFLDQYAVRMPRTALRYAIERLTPRQRQSYLRR